MVKLYNKPYEFVLKLWLSLKMADDTFIKRAIDKATDYLGYNEVKELQWKVIAEVVSGRDVFAVLPTGLLSE